LDVFRYFPENPALNDAIPCGIKNRVRALRAANEGADGRKRSPEQLPTEALLACAHTHNDDEELQRRYRLQLWFLNFYKYVYSLICSVDIAEEAAQSEEEDIDRQAIADKQERLARLQESIVGNAALQSKKLLAQGKQASRNLVRRLARQAASQSIWSIMKPKGK